MLSIFQRLPIAAKHLRARLVCQLFLALSCSSVSAQESPYSKAGPYQFFTVSSVALQDNSRGTAMEVLVRYPEGAGPFPVVVFSHGSLSNKETFGPASEHWASHGYVVIHPNHADARSGTGMGARSRNRFGGEELGGNDTGNLDTANSNNQKRFRRGAGVVLGGFGGAAGNTGRIERIKDITRVLDALDQVERQIPTLQGRLNREAIAVAGHSFGAYVAQCHGGVKTLVDGTLENLSDPRVKCVVPISAQGESQSYGLTAESWAEARTPALHITGTRDRSAPDRPGGPMGDVSTKVIPFERSPAGGKYLLVIEGATHVSFGGRLSGVRGGVDAAGLTKAVSLAFLDAYLKQDAEAKRWLDGQASVVWLGAQAKLQRKP
jgi:predicted dienelactone hydrolase